MNQLETNLALWAICSIILFEILIIICLCRCCFNRIKPKNFYVKREEYEYLQDIHNGTQSKYQPTILRPPHADELALIGTIRGQNSLVPYNDGFQNLGFYRDDENERIPPIQPSSSSSPPNWIELQPTIINTSQLSPADYEIHSYPTDNYLNPLPPPRPTIIDFHQYQNDDNDDDDEIENFHFHSIRRPEIILPQIQRKDTSTESYAINYSNIVPKSILKSSTSITPPIDIHSSSYLQPERNRTLSNYEESPRTSVKINTDETIISDYPINVIEKHIPFEPIASLTLPLSTKHRMKFASVSRLNDIEWEVPREFQTIIQKNSIFYSTRQRTPSTIIDSKIHTSWQREMNIHEPNYLSNGDITQQQAFEY